MKDPSITRQNFFATLFWCLHLKILRPSVPMQRYRSEVVFCLHLSSDLSPHNIAISSIFLHIFCHATFSCWLRISLKRSVAWVWFSTGSSYTGLVGYVTTVGGQLGGISNCVLSFWQKYQFSMLFQLLPRKGLAWYYVLPESVYMQGSFSRVSSWLRHIVLLNCVLRQLSRDWLLLIGIRQLRFDYQTSKFDLDLYFWNSLIATRMFDLLLKLTFEKQFAKFEMQPIWINSIERMKWNCTN